MVPAGSTVPTVPRGPAAPAVLLIALVLIAPTDRPGLLGRRHVLCDPMRGLPGRTLAHLVRLGLRPARAATFLLLAATMVPRARGRGDLPGVPVSLGGPDTADGRREVLVLGDRRGIYGSDLSVGSDSSERWSVLLSTRFRPPRLAA